MNIMRHCIQDYTVYENNQNFEGAHATVRLERIIKSPISCPIHVRPSPQKSEQSLMSELGLWDIHKPCGQLRGRGFANCQITILLHKPEHEGGGQKYLKI